MHFAKGEWKRSRNKEVREKTVQRWGKSIQQGRMSGCERKNWSGKEVIVAVKVGKVIKDEVWKVANLSNGLLFHTEGKTFKNFEQRGLMIWTEFWKDLSGYCVKRICGVGRGGGWGGRIKAIIHVSNEDGLVLVEVEVGRNIQILDLRVDSTDISWILFKIPKSDNMYVQKDWSIHIEYNKSTMFISIKYVTSKECFIKNFIN